MHRQDSEQNPEQLRDIVAEAPTVWDDMEEAKKRPGDSGPSKQNTGISVTLQAGGSVGKGVCPRIRKITS